MRDPDFDPAINSVGYLTDSAAHYRFGPITEPLPCFFFSHGSTLMMGERSAPAAYWEEVGRQALAQGVERIVFMGAHWEVTDNRIMVSANPKPAKQPVSW